MAQIRPFVERLLEAKSWPALLDVLLDHDMYLIRPISKIAEHPCWVPFLELLRNDESSVAQLIGYLDTFHVLGLWSLVLLPELTGENPIPERYRNINELHLEITYWSTWAEKKGITPILDF